MGGVRRLNNTIRSYLLARRARKSRRFRLPVLNVSGVTHRDPGDPPHHGNLFGSAAHPQGRSPSHFLLRRPQASQLLRTPNVVCLTLGALGPSWGCVASAGCPHVDEAAMPMSRRLLSKGHKAGKEYVYGLDICFAPAAGCPCFHDAIKSIGQERHEERQLVGGRRGAWLWCTAVTQHAHLTFLGFQFGSRGRHREPNLLL